MKLKGVNYGPILCAVGARGFHKEGYWWHWIWMLIGLTWSKTGFIAKTMTLEKRDGTPDENGKLGKNGNMELKSDGVSLKEWLPKAIWVQMVIGGAILNVLGLPNFGIRFYLEKKILQNFQEPFGLSIMAVGNNATEQIKKICLVVISYTFNAPFYVEINFGCPNTGEDPIKHLENIISQLKVAREILSSDIPIVANFNALIDINTLKAIEKYVDGYKIGNSIPAGSTDNVKWKNYNVKVIDGVVSSPLTDRDMPGAGGLSGKECFPITVEKVKEMREAKIEKPICAGNGIRSKADVIELKQAGADSCFIGSVALTQPWAMRSIIREAHKQFSV